MKRTSISRHEPAAQDQPFHRGRASAIFVFALVAVAVALFAIGDQPHASASTSSQSTGQLHEALFSPGPSFNVRKIVYPAAHDFDTSPGTDTCLSLSVPPGDTFTLSLEWEALFGGQTEAGDLDLYLYLDSACTESALLTSSFNSNAYTGELAEITPQVRNVSSSPAVAGIRIGRRSGKGNPGQLRLTVLTGRATFLEHGTTGPPLTGQEGAPVFQVTGPFSIPENSATGTAVGTVTATDPQSETLTFFELEPAAGQTSFQVDPVTGLITVEDPALLDRESTATVVYWIGVTDGVSASLKGVGISLSGVNDNPPTALPATAVTATDTPVVVALTGADADIGPAQVLVMSIVTQPANGFAGVPFSQGEKISSVIYTPSPGFIGTDSFTFTVSDGMTTSALATAAVTVTDDPTLLPSPTPVPGPGTPSPAAMATPVSTATPIGGPAPTPTPTGSPVVGPTATSAPGSGPTPTPSAPTGPAPPVLQPPTSGAPTEPVVPPSAPRFVRAEARDGSALITWQRPLSDGGAPIDGYRIFNINNARSTLILGDALEGYVRGLENGTSYLFQIRAFNSAGFGEGALVGPVTPTSGNPALIDVSASVHPDDTVSVWWSPPEDVRLKPVAVYRLWTEAGELIETIAPGEALIVNVKDLENDALHSFRVSASDADGELIATGVTDPVYLPPVLAAAYEPMPPDAILVPLSEQAKAELQLAIHEAAGGAGTVMDAPAVLTVRDGVALLYLQVEGLHRGLELPPGFVVISEQLMIGETAPGEGIGIELEIEAGVWLSRSIQPLIDPSGVLFRLTAPMVSLVHVPVDSRPVSSVAFVYSPASLAPGFRIAAKTPTDVPPAVTQALAAPSIRKVAALVEVVRSGLVVSDSLAEQVRIELTTGWHRAQVDAGRDLRLWRFDPDGMMTSATFACALATETSTVTCSADLVGDSSELSFYAVVAVSDTKQPQSTPLPTVVSAPVEPTPTAGPALVIVIEPTPVAAPAPTVSATPQVTPTPSEPIVPETGGGLGGATVITWLMSGILGLVVIRGAFYAVGKIRA